MLPGTRGLSGQEVVVTVQTVKGLPGPLVRVTWYFAPEICWDGRLHPTVMAVLEVAFAVGEVGADKVAASACAGLLESVPSQ